VSKQSIADVLSPVVRVIEAEYWVRVTDAIPLIDEALAAERRATVERIRAALLLHEGEAIPEDYATAILDAEAAR
jgi:hypothetical protein